MNRGKKSLKPEEEFSSGVKTFKIILEQISMYCVKETDFHIFVRGGWINIWGGGGGGVLLLALAGAWWQRPERPRKKFNKICFLGLHGEI